MGKIQKFQLIDINLKATRFFFVIGFFLNTGVILWMQNALGEAFISGKSSFPTMDSFLSSCARLGKKRVLDPVEERRAAERLFYNNLDGAMGSEIIFYDEEGRTSLVKNLQCLTVTQTNWESWQTISAVGSNEIENFNVFLQALQELNVSGVKLDIYIKTILVKFFGDFRKKNDSVGLVKCQVDAKLYTYAFKKNEPKPNESVSVFDVFRAFTERKFSNLDLRTTFLKEITDFNERLNDFLIKKRLVLLPNTPSIYFHLSCNEEINLN
ncbi:MAG: hypothetical protein K1X29_04400 [Bdellovibrionales bacterium]|nr:hypothetical protein [Bdellovibrionales bacterium]